MVPHFRSHDCSYLTTLYVVFLLTNIIVPNIIVPMYPLVFFNLFNSGTYFPPRKFFSQTATSAKTSRTDLRKSSFFLDPPPRRWPSGAAPLQTMLRPSTGSARSCVSPDTAVLKIFGFQLNRRLTDEDFDGFFSRK